MNNPLAELLALEPIKPREEYGEPHPGYFVSDNEFFEANRFTSVWLMEHEREIRALLANQRDVNPVEAIEAELDAAHTSADPRAVDTLVDALDQTLRARGLTIVPAEELAADVRELSAALLDEQQRLEWLMQKVHCDEIGDEIQIPFGLSLGRHFDEFRRQIDQAKGEGDRG